MEDAQMMNEEQVKRTVADLILAGDELADEAQEFSDDQQPAEAERYRQRATALYSAVVQIATAYPMPREQVVAMTRLACVSADAGARDASQDLLQRAERLADEQEDAGDLIQQIHAERQGIMELVQ